MGVPMPPVVVLIICKSLLIPYSTPLNEANSKFTGHENRKWDTEDSVMHCRRVEVPLSHPTATKFTPMDCQRAAITEGVNWDQKHKSSKYRWWRSACPVPIVNTISGEIIDWKLPECPRINRKDRVAVECDVDTAI